MAIRQKKTLGLRRKKTNKDVLGVCVISKSHFLRVFTYVSNDAETEKA